MEAASKNHGAGTITEPQLAIPKSKHSNEARFEEWEKPTSSMWKITTLSEVSNPSFSISVNLLIIF